MVNVPSAYRHNPLRFLLVARQVPILPVPADSLYRRKLEDDPRGPRYLQTARGKGYRLLPD